MDSEPWAREMKISLTNPSRSHTLRPATAILAAYVTSSIIGGFAIFPYIYLTGAISAEDYILPVVISWMSIFLPICFTLELFILTPVLFILRHNRWDFPSFFGSSLLGFCAGSIPVFLIFLTPIEGALSTAEGNFKDGHITQQGLMLAFHNATIFGIVGVVCAVVFRAIAVREVPPSS